MKLSVSPLPGRQSLSYMHAIHVTKLTIYYGCSMATGLLFTAQSTIPYACKILT